MSKQTACTPAQLQDSTNKERIHECSTVNSCYDFGAHAYSNDKCGIAESCGTWRKKGDVLLQGCIRSEFCDVDAEYEGHATKYNCPQGAKKLVKPPPAGSDVPQAAGVPASTPERPQNAGAPDQTGREPLFSLAGYSDLDILDGIEGLAGGLMKKDVRGSFDTCYEGIPRIVKQTETEVVSIDWKDLLNWSKDWKEVQDSWGFMENVMKEVPEEIASCSTIVTDVIEFVIHLINSISWTLLASNLSTGAMGVMMGLMAKGTDLGVAFAAHDFYKMGQDVGYMINTVLDLGVPK